MIIYRHYLYIYIYTLYEYYIYIYVYYVYHHIFWVHPALQLEPTKRKIYSTSIFCDPRRQMMFQWLSQIHGILDKAKFLWSYPAPPPPMIR